MRHPLDWLAHFVLCFAVALVFGPTCSIICGLTVEATQIEAAFFAGKIMDIDVGDTCMDILADGLGVWAGTSFRKVLLGNESLRTTR